MRQKSLFHSPQAQDIGWKYLFQNFCTINIISNTNACFVFSTRLQMGRSTEDRSSLFIGGQRWKIREHKMRKTFVPRRGIEPRPRRWERRILTTRPPGTACTVSRSDCFFPYVPIFPPSFALFFLPPRLQISVPYCFVKERNISLSIQLRKDSVKYGTGGNPTHRTT